MTTAVSKAAAGRRITSVVGFFLGVSAAALLLMLPPPEDLSVAAWRTAAVGSLMAVWWMTEAIPIPATALLPLIFFPLLDIANIRAAAAPYANPLIFLFLGGFIIAVAMERWNLHRRIALRIIHYVGGRPTRIVTGFAVAAAFLSMWVSNTATALMMLPIGLSVVELVRTDAGGRHMAEDGARAPVDDHPPIIREGQKEGENFATNLMLVIAYACTIGGMATLIGTPPNAFFAGFMLETYERTIGFLEWMQLGLPLALVALPIMLVVLTRIIYPIRLRTLPGGADYVSRSLRSLGRMQTGEKMVAGVFATTALLWMTRPLLEDILPGLSDAGIAIAMALLLFILPVDIRRGQFVLRWEDAERLPWGVLILFGGGLSLAAAIDQTGLAAWIGSRAHFLEGWPPLLVIMAVTATIVLLTELTSNTATAAAFIPIAASVAVGLGHDPLTMAVPAALAASAAFMLPVATPPNAIVYGSGMISIGRMVRGGLILNLLFVALLSLAAYVLVPVIFPS